MGKVLGGKVAEEKEGYRRKLHERAVIRRA